MTTNTIKKAIGASNTNGLHTDTNSIDSRTGRAAKQARLKANSGLQDLALTTTATEARIDTRLLAQGFGNKHRNSLRLIEQYLDRFQMLGKVSFKNAPLPDSKTGQSERFALLNEDQAYLLLSLSRNSDAVVSLKVKLVKAFAVARQSAEMRRSEYMPSLRRLQEVVQAKSVSSSNQSKVQINMARLVNKAAGIEAGQRASAPIGMQAMLIVAQQVAAQAMQEANDHHDGYQRAKQSLLKLAAMTMQKPLLLAPTGRSA